MSARGTPRLAALLVLSALPRWGASARGDAPPRIKDLGFAGNGCTQSDSQGRLFDTDQDGLPDQFVLLFSRLIAETGSGIPAANQRRECKISIHLGLPRGTQFAITAVRFEGYADLPSGVTGRQLATYTFPSLGSRSGETLLEGALAESYERLDHFEGVPLWSRCGSDVPLQIRTEVRIENAGGREAFLTTDAADGLVTHRYLLSWRPCH